MVRLLVHWIFLFCCGFLQAEKVPDFEKCKHLFYNKQEVKGFDDTYKKVCHFQNDTYVFATLYNKDNTSPLYSAFILNSDECESSINLASEWVESECPPDQKINKSNHDTAKELNSYTSSNYYCSNRILNSYDCGQVPMDHIGGTDIIVLEATFYEFQWKMFEEAVRVILGASSTNGTVYVITGLVPSDQLLTVKSLCPFYSATDEVTTTTVPCFIWRALCFEAADPQDSFSLAFMGNNKRVMKPVTVKHLEHILKKQYNQTDFQIFDSCSHEKDNEMFIRLSAQVFVPEFLKKIAKENFSPNARRTLERVFFKGLQHNTFGSHMEHILVEDMSVKMEYKSFDDWFQSNEKLKANDKQTCILQSSGTLKFEGTQEVEESNLICSLRSEKSMPLATVTADGTPCIAGDYCDVKDGRRECRTESGSMPCCSSPCLYSSNQMAFFCRSLEQTISCSPQYSIVTISNKLCVTNQGCATYGKNYYWCFTQDGSWDYCIPPAVQGITIKGVECISGKVCGTYGKKYTWCYIDTKNNWDYCCLSNIPNVAINGKMCRSDHKCGTYGKNYNWCYTGMDNSWDYCCIPQI
ncbi:uncharacterized protein LOC120518893 [Polypterus senegalus]|uniref:uncharacterized protein LOC120518893 n=1 Tax=Polypterus senegalus TaxID=55291 RepID=UPI0019663232|nr:uncharacterized protein LOC120518893 [Polypterus senegalus]